ncbi:MAG: lipocalin family protein [Gammaproteobacteria bacterium]|nr:lipocalin family protein [Gammaproteobacteria bacterium]MDH5305441.1 lipocalin family protein [Gammaproteobacteria bacterium]
MTGSKILAPLLILTILVAACTGLPKGASAVSGFELDRYLGTWYEIARLDHRFERGLSNVSASYTLRDDGGVRVLNKGFNKARGEWNEAIGKAYFADSPDVGRLKVSFFGPFYGGYNILELDFENYEYALVAGPSRSYLWILARSPNLSADIVQALVEKARSLDFPVDELIFVSHDPLVAE